MKCFFWMLGLSVTLVAAAAPKDLQPSAVTNAPAGIELKDQFESRQMLSFPTTNLTVLTIADHKGSEQIAGWVAPIKDRYGLRLDICGIADLSTVPGWLRGRVRKSFRQQQSHPIMLDWSGDTVKAFAAVNDCANVFVLDERGRILKRFTGGAQPRALAELYATIDQALTRNQPPVVAK